MIGAQKLRDLAQSPIIINSAYRCANYNASPRVGGSKNSQHVKGCALDIHITGYHIKDQLLMASCIEEFATGGIGLYPLWIDNKGNKRGNFLHVDVRGYFKRWCKYKDVYINFERGLKLI
jgi:uncharacterized protein YcbK (DUF882 family)